MSHQKHLEAQSQLTGAVDNNDWNNLVHSVVKLEEVKEERKKALTGSKKQSAELLEQSNHDGAKLIKASMVHMNRSHTSAVDSSVSKESGSDQHQPHPHHDRNTT